MVIVVLSFLGPCCTLVLIINYLYSSSRVWVDRWSPGCHVGSLRLLGDDANLERYIKDSNLHYPWMLLIVSYTNHYTTASPYIIFNATIFWNFSREITKGDESTVPSIPSLSVQTVHSIDHWGHMLRGASPHPPSVSLG